jgi:hypothetical protein
MADQANIFTQGQEPAPQANPQEPAQQPTPAPEAPTLAPEVAAMVGEGRKYATVEAALASVPHAQTHIASLESENQALTQQVADLKAKLEAANHLEDVVAQLSATQQPQEPPIPTGLDEQGVLKLLEQRDAARIAQANQVAVTEALVTKFGDTTKATEALTAKATEFGVDFDYMVQLAAKSPKAVLSYFNVETKPASVVPSYQPVPAQYQTPPEPTYDFTPKGNSTSDLVQAFRTCGLAVNNGNQINHSI